jgi:hypothetical protein
VGEKYVKVNGTELSTVTVHCPKCGTGIQVDLTKDLHAQVRTMAVCMCGEQIPEALRDVLLRYKTALDIITKGNYKATFEIKAE